MNSHEKWDRRFLDLASLVASWSRDPSTQTGAVIVRPNKTICSVGFNGFPRQMPDDFALYQDREQKYSRIVHCEINSLIFAGESVEGYTLYTFPFASCDRCAVQMIQAGVARFVYPTLPDHLKERWGASLAKSEAYFAECGLEYTSITME
jgi:dCMP deaminase